MKRPVFAAWLSFLALILVPMSKAADLTVEQMLKAANALATSPFEEADPAPPPVVVETTVETTVEALDVNDINCHGAPWWIPTYAGCNIVCCETCNTTNPAPCFHRVIDGLNYCYGPISCSWPALPAKLWSGNECAEEQWQWYLERRRYYEGEYLARIISECKVAAHPGSKFPWACDSSNFYDCSCMTSKWSQLLIDLNTIYATYKWRYKNFCIPCDPWTTNPYEAVPRAVCPETCDPVCCVQYNDLRDLADGDFADDLAFAFHDCDLINAAFARLQSRDDALRILLLQCCLDHGSP